MSRVKKEHSISSLVRDNNDYDIFDDKIDFISDDLDKVDIKQKRHENAQNWRNKHRQNFLRNIVMVLLMIRFYIEKFL